MKDQLNMYIFPRILSPNGPWPNLVLPTTILFIVNNYVIPIYQTHSNRNSSLCKSLISILYLDSLRVFIMQGLHHGFPFFGRTLLSIFFLIYTCNSSFLSQVCSQQHVTITHSFIWFIIIQIHQSHKQHQSINIVWFPFQFRTCL
jgi:hypothetical protein